MKKLIIVLFTVLISIQGVAYSKDEQQKPPPYHNATFPNNDVLVKYLQSKNSDGIFSIIGKQKLSENSYKVFVRMESFGRKRIRGISLIKLDTNFWIIDGEHLLVQ